MPKSTWMRLGKDEKKVWNFLRDYPYRAFLPEVRLAVDAIDANILHNLTKFKSSPHYGCTPAEAMMTEEFFDTCKRTSGVPRHFTPPQEEVLSSQATERFMVGANRCGKTLLSSLECAWWAKGRHPYRKVPDPPNVIWSCAPDWPNYLRPINKKLIAWALGKAGAGSYKFRTADRIFVVEATDGEGLAVNSQIILKSYDSGAEKFGGEDVDLVANDEPPPFSVYEEQTMRLGENPLNFFFSLTPVGGNAPAIYTMYRDWKDEGRPEDKHFVSLSIDDNPYLPKTEVAKAYKRWGKDEKVANVRLRGNWESIGGMLYGCLSPGEVVDKGTPSERTVAVHIVDDFEIPGVHREPEHGELPWTLYRTIDPGMRNEAACAWVAVSPEGHAFVYREFHEAELTIPKQCMRILAAQTPREFYRWTTIDIASTARDYDTGKPRHITYAENGVMCIPVSNRVKSGQDGDQVSEVTEWLDWKMEDGHFAKEPRLRFFRSCHESWLQFRNAAWKATSARSGEDPKETTLKKRDHLENAIRYLLCAHGGPTYATKSETPVGMKGDPVTGY